MTQIPEAIHGEAGLIVSSKTRIAFDRGTAKWIGVQHRGLAEGAVEHLHHWIGSEPVAVVEILVVSGIKVFIEQADAVPGGGRDQESGVFARCGQQRQPLRAARIHAFKSSRQHPSSKTDVIVGKKGQRSLREAAQDVIPAGSHPEISERSGDLNGLDQWMATLLDVLQLLLQFVLPVGVIGRTVVNDGERFDWYVEAGKKPVEQIDPVEDRHPQKR